MRRGQIAGRRRGTPALAAASAAVLAVMLASAASAAPPADPTAPVYAMLGDRVMVGTATVPDINGRSIIKLQTQKGDWIGCAGAIAAYGPGGGPVSAECSNREKLIGQFRVLSDTSGYGAFPTRPDHVPFHFTYGLALKDAAKHLGLQAGQTLVQGADGVVEVVGASPP
ncbi:MAG TPA: hypothetical protein VGI95_11345 [Caulobacteraceae bacterium]|jgi:hypothetical protein